MDVANWFEAFSSGLRMLVTTVPDSVLPIHMITGMLAVFASLTAVPMAVLSFGSIAMMSTPWLMSDSTADCCFAASSANAKIASTPCALASVWAALTALATTETIGG